VKEKDDPFGGGAPSREISTKGDDYQQKEKEDGRRKKRSR